MTIVDILSLSLSHTNKRIKMKAKVGQYHFCKHRGAWGIYLYTNVSDTSSSASFIKDVISYEDAIREIYALNGWGIPQNIKQAF